MRKFNSSNDVERGTGPKIDSFGVQKVIEHSNGFSIRNGECTRNVVNEGCQVVGDTALTDALGAISLDVIDKQLYYTPSVIELPERSTSFPPLAT